MRRAYPEDDAQRTDCLQVLNYRDGGRGLGDLLTGEPVRRGSGAAPGFPVTDDPDGGWGGAMGFTVP